MFAPDLRTGKHTFSLHCEKSSSELRNKTKKRKVFDRFININLFDDQAKFLTQSKEISFVYIPYFTECIYLFPFPQMFIHVLHFPECIFLTLTPIVL